LAPYGAARIFVIGLALAGVDVLWQEIHVAYFDYCRVGVDQSESEEGQHNGSSIRSDPGVTTKNLVKVMAGVTGDRPPRFLSFIQGRNNWRLLVIMGAW